MKGKLSSDSSAPETLHIKTTSKTMENEILSQVGAQLLENLQWRFLHINYVEGVI